MTLTECIDQARETKRSPCFVFACKNSELKARLDWITRYHGNRTMQEIINTFNGN